MYVHMHIAQRAPFTQRETGGLNFPEFGILVPSRTFTKMMYVLHAFSSNPSRRRNSFLIRLVCRLLRTKIIETE